MAQATWTCNKDARVATSGGSDLGSGTSLGLPTGLYSGYLYRSLLGFAYSFAGMVSVTHAELRMRTSNQIHIAFGSDPDIYVQRCSAAWSEGSSSGLSGSNAVHWDNQPGVVGTRHAVDVPTTESTWVYVDVTAAIQEAKAAGVFHGFKVWAQDEGSSSDVTEFYSREQGSNDAYIVVDYSTNVGPGVPTPSSPVGGNAVSATPTFVFSHNDSDGDALLKYDLQVSSDPAFAVADRWNASQLTTGIAGNVATVPYGGAALTRGVTYYWRARTYSVTGVLTAGPYGSIQSFRVATLPVITMVSPNVDGALAEMAYAIGWNTPRFVTRFAVSEPPAQWMVHYWLDDWTYIASTGWQTSPDMVATLGIDLTRGAFYRTQVVLMTTAGEQVDGPQVRGKAQWAVAAYRSNDLGQVTNWSVVAASTAGANQRVVTEYGSSTTAAGVPSAWYATMGEVPIDKTVGAHNYFHWRVWLMAWSGAASPSFDRMTLTFTSASGVPPDGWTFNNSNYAIDTSAKVYGTQSLKYNGAGSDSVAFQTVPVQRNTDYILSGRIKSDGNSGAGLQIVNAAHNAVLQHSEPLVAAAEWARVKTPVWNSGDNDACIVRCDAYGPAAAWFDALKLESSRVVTSWVPGLVGYGLSVDAGGIKIDASPRGGATFRLQGAAGTVRGVMELGDAGWKYGGDTEFNSPSTGVMAVNGVPLLRAGDVPAGLRFVPVTPFDCKNSSTTASIAKAHTGDIGTIPTNAVAVAVQFVGRHTVLTNAGRIYVYGYGGTRALAEVAPGTAANQYVSGNVHWVPLGGTNNREFDWEVVLGAAGNIAYILTVQGYWTYN